MTAPTCATGESSFGSPGGWRHCRVMGSWSLVAWGGVLGQGRTKSDRRALQDFLIVDYAGDRGRGPGGLADLYGRVGLH